VQQPNESKKTDSICGGDGGTNAKLVTKSDPCQNPSMIFQRDVGGKFRIPVKPQIKTVGTGGWILAASTEDQRTSLYQIQASSEQWAMTGDWIQSRQALSTEAGGPRCINTNE